MVGVVMILHVWAMYNWLRQILGILLALFFLEIISNLRFAIIATVLFNLSGMYALTEQTMSYTDQLSTAAPLVFHLVVTTNQILNLSFCIVYPTSSIWPQVADIFQIMHGVAMCILAIIQFL